jgi:hypothetical protein
MLTPVGETVNPLTVAARGKGGLLVARRVGTIGTRYGVTPRRMARRISTIQDLLQRYGWSATLPITAAAFERHPRTIARYSTRGIEFAVHGYYHVDHTKLSDRTQSTQLGRARELLEANGVATTGFRAPYLRWTEATLRAVQDNGYTYDGSQAMHWEVDDELVTDAYRRALAFYGSLSAEEHPVLPWTEGGVVRIPYCLPDDEAVVDRLALSPETIERTWLRILDASIDRGELFTLAVHPERISSCLRGVVAVLERARSLAPMVWVARHDEIARWWSARAAAAVAVHDRPDSGAHVSVRGPAGLTVLARAMPALGGTPLGDGYTRLQGTEIELPPDRRPFIGVHPASPGAVVSFLREHGYVVEVSAASHAYGFFVERGRFEPEDRRPLLSQIEAGGFPLLRLGRWPGGAKSALALTGDVDALTIWDYASRFFGR